MTEGPPAGQTLAEASEAMVGLVGQALPGWVLAQVARLIEAWGQVPPEAARRALEAAATAGVEAGRVVATELGALLREDPAEQRATPLEVVRRAVAGPTRVLAEAGVPEVVRDAFAERSWPEDVYDLTPRTFKDIDDDLAAVHFAWGVAKAAVLRSRIGS